MFNNQVDPHSGDLRLLPEAVACRLCLECSSEGAHETAVLYVRGEVDFQTAPAVRPHLLTAMDQANQVIVELSEVSYCAGAGLSLLEEFGRLCQATRVDLVVVCPLFLRKIIVSLGLDAHLMLADSVGDARSLLDLLKRS